VPFGFLLVH